MNLSDALARFRLIGFIEGLSYVLLLGIAMPLKYYFELPIAVKIVGWTHGALFMLYMAALLAVATERRWSIVRATIGFAAAIIPLATFVFDRSLSAEQRRHKG